MPVPPAVPRLRRLLGSPWSDALLAAAATIAQTAPLLFLHSDSGRPWHWWGYVATVGSSLPLAARRRSPVVVLLSCAAFAGLYDLADPAAPQPLWYGVLIALHGVASTAPPRVRIPVFTVMCATGLLTVGSLDTATRGIVLYVAAYALGRASAGSRAEAAVLAERALRLERERRTHEERAAERERARIARDMHDVLAHSLSLMIVQAEAGPVVLAAQPARAAEAFGAIAGTGRQALDQLRRMLAVLHDTDGADSTRPTIHDLPVLVEQVAGAGIEVRLTTEGTPGPIPADRGLAVYRIAQEALTNVVKHAGARHAEIRLRWHDQGLELHILDDGHGVSGTALPSGGNGLTGIRERAAACGGTATAGPRADHRPGFEVRALLPLTTHEPAVPA